MPEFVDGRRGEQEGGDEQQEGGVAGQISGGRTGPDPTQRYGDVKGNQRARTRTTTGRRNSGRSVVEMCRCTRSGRPDPKTQGEQRPR